MGNTIEFLDLGRQPLANGFLEKVTENEYFYNLKVSFDQDTNLVRLNKFVDPERMFNSDYHYVSSGSEPMRRHFEDISKSLQHVFEPKLALEIGSNDGVFLKHFNPDRAIAVEPCGNFAKITNDLGYKTYPDFWERKTAEKILANHGQVDLIYSANCISHIPNIHETFTSLYDVLNEKGVLVIEDPSMLDVVKNVSYDQIYDEHAFIFSALSLDSILKPLGMRIFKIERLNIHGGSRRYFIDKMARPQTQSVQNEIEMETFFGLNDIDTYFHFSEKIERSRKDLRNILLQFKNENKKIVSYGATGKSTTIFNYCDIGPEVISYIVDSTPGKQGKLSPGMHIPIKPPSEFNSSVDVGFLGAWNFSSYIIEKEKWFKEQNKTWVTHVPKVRII